MRLRLTEWSSRLLNQLARAAQDPKGAREAGWVFELFTPAAGALPAPPAAGPVRAGQIDLLACLAEDASPAVQDAWRDAIGVRGDLELAQALVGLVRPADEAAWLAAARAYHACPPATLRMLVAGLAEQGRAPGAQVLADLVAGLRGLPAVRRFLAVLGTFRSTALPSGSLERLLLPRCATDEDAAVAASIGRHLARAGREDYGPADLDRLLQALPTRVATKRWTAALALFEQHGLQVDALDAFVLGFTGTREDLRWLQAAVQELADVSKPVTRVALMGLREWAPDEPALVRYSRGVRALAGSGLTPDEIDQYLLPCLRDEERLAVAAMIGQLGQRRHGQLSLAQAESLLGGLPTRAAVKRFELATTLLRDAGVRPSDADALAPSFVAAREDLIWLEAVVRQAHATGRPVDRLELLQLRERCPDPGALYRYFKLRAELERCKAMSAADRETIAIEGAAGEPRADGLLELLRLLARRERLADLDVRALRALQAAFPDPSAVARYDRATAELRGDPQAIDTLAIELASDDERAAAIALIGRTLAARNLHDLDGNPRLAPGLRQMLARLEAERRLPRGERGDKLVA